MALARIRLSATRLKTHSMDFNVYGWQRYQPKKVSRRRLVHRLYEEQTYETFLRYFRSNYYGNRAPVHIGLHYVLFKRLLYWTAAARFAAAVCKLPEVKCVRYVDLIAALEKLPADRFTSASGLAAALADPGLEPFGERLDPVADVEQVDEAPDVGAGDVAALLGVGWTGEERPRRAVVRGVDVALWELEPLVRVHR